MEKLVKGYISEMKDTRLNESFKGEVADTPKKWPIILGAEHPFNFIDAEKVYQTVGLVAGVINKYTDAIVGDFKVKVEDPNAQTILDNFIKDSNFQVIIRSWVNEALLKGNGFIELDLKNNKLRVMNANYMYVKRDKFGKVLEYNQFTGDLNKFSRESKLFVNFKENEIAHLPLNKIPNQAYGLGIVMPNERVIENIVKSEQDYAKLISRKAGAPIHVTVGQPGESVQQAAIDSFSASLQYMNNRTEWVTDANVKMEVMQFGEIGKNVTDNLMYNFRMFLAGVGVPEVMMGSGQLNEGIAKVQNETFIRDIKSKRILIQSIIEEKIFNVILKNNSFQVDVEFEWDSQSEEERNARIVEIQSLLGTMGISTNMKRALEIELAQLMDMEELINILPSPEKGLEEKERQAEEIQIGQPEIPGAKKNIQPGKVKQELELKEDLPVPINEQIPVDNLTVEQFINISEVQEAQPLNYSDLIMKVIQITKKDPFTDLAAQSKEDINIGLLPEKDINKLRLIMKNGFRKNQTINQIEKEIKDNINLKDRTDQEDNILLTADARPNMIARTETVRLANEGLKDLYSENGIKKVSFLAALSDRTCEICQGLNSQIFDMNELQVGVNQPPIHPCCRCSLLSVQE
jgi:SPP1 gp7 family putative phage head morphogenesis protein